LKADGGSNREPVHTPVFACARKTILHLFLSSRRPGRANGFALRHRLSFQYHRRSDGLKKLTNRDVARGDRTMRKLKKNDVDAVFDQLHAMGWIDRTPDLRPGRRTETIWTVNPRVHFEHAGRAKDEAERRSRNQKMIVEIPQCWLTGLNLEVVRIVFCSRVA